MKIIVCINGLPPAIRNLDEFLHGYGSKRVLEGIRLGLATCKHWSGTLRGNEVHIMDFKTVEGLLFDEYAMENDR